MTDLPSTVAATGMLVCCASLSTWSCKPKRWTSTSARITGWRARVIISRASRRASDDDDGRLLGKGLRRGVGDFQSPDAISDAHGAQTADARVSIRGETGALLVTSVDEP